jgi:hypothetical protein
MSTFVPIPNGADLEIRLTLFDRPLELTLHAVAISPPQTSSMRSSLATQVDIWFRGQLLPLLSSDLVYRETVVTDATVVGGDQSAVSVAPASGGQTIGSYSAMVAAVIAFRPPSNVSIRSNRNYIPGIHGGISVGGRLTSTFMNAAVSAYNNLIDIMPLAGWRWVAVHRFNGSTPRTSAATGNVQAARFNQRVTGQRRKRVSNSF